LPGRRRAFFIEYNSKPYRYNCRDREMNMPLPYAALHLLLSLGCLLLALRLQLRSRTMLCFCLSLLLLVFFGFIVERWLDAGLFVMRLTGPDLLFFTNLSLEGAAALLVLLWRSAGDKRAKRRALVLSAPLLALVLWSYAWYFAPLPERLTGRVDTNGYCHQTSDDSCSAAAAVMLLNARGIPTTEAEMAVLCLTRAKYGTPTLGMCRGLALKSAPRGWRVRLVHATPAKLYTLGAPCIISVGISPFASRAVIEKMAQYGWEPGQYHAVVVLRGEPNGQWVEVADPSYGQERWPTEHLAVLWSGKALLLMRH
jgi:hypothetical protein